MKTKRIKFLDLGAIAFVVLLLSNSSVFSQNPWETNNIEPNPWVEKSETKSIETETNKAPTSTAEIKVAFKDSTTQIAVFSNSSLNNSNEYTVLNSEGNGALIGSILTSSIFSIFSVPLNFLVPQLTTLDNNASVKEYKEQNPEAKAIEIQTVKNKVRRKKAGKAAIGSLVGIAVNAIIIVLLTL